MTEKLIGAIEAGGTKFVAALARADGTVLAEARIPTETPATCFPALANFFREAAAVHGSIAAFGVASFGPINIDPASPDYGRFTTTPKPRLGRRAVSPIGPREVATLVLASPGLSGILKVRLWVKIELGLMAKLVFVPL